MLHIKLHQTQKFKEDSSAKLFDSGLQWHLKEVTEMYMVVLAHILLSRVLVYVLHIMPRLYDLLFLGFTVLKKSSERHVKVDTWLLSSDRNYISKKRATRI